jgi:hypothetical protein
MQINESDVSSESEVIDEPIMEPGLTRAELDAMAASCASDAQREAFLRAVHRAPYAYENNHNEEPTCPRAAFIDTLLFHGAHLGADEISEMISVLRRGISDICDLRELEECESEL